MKPNLRVGLIGHGVMGKNHERVLSGLEGVSIIGIVDEISNHSKSRISFKDLIALQPDYCIISTPTKSHLKIGQELAQSGISFLVEKPVCIDTGSAKSLIALRDHNNVKAGVGHIERFNSAMVKAKALLAENYLGQIYQVNTRRRGPFPNRIQDVGVAKDLGTHDFDITRWLTGEEYSSLFSVSARKSDLGNEDMIITTGTLDSGVLFNNVIDWLSPIKERKVTITGENGAFVIDTLKSELIFFKNGSYESTDRYVSHFRGVTQGDIINIAFPKKEALETEHSNFRDFMLNEQSSIVSLEDGLKSLEIAEAAKMSSDEGRVVDL
jgi:UDP-N-acetylglucosamine 3-dehydrogenase